MAPTMSWWVFTLFCLLSSLSFPNRASAQYNQEYILMNYARYGNVARNWPFWRPDSSYAQAISGILLDPQSVFLEYNCFYMREICVNAQNWLNTARAQARTNPRVFGFDFSTFRKDQRRERSCPTGTNSWANNHVCPEIAQRLPMRNDKEWPLTGLEPFLIPFVTNPIEARRDPITHDVIEESGMRYSCEEFPPATWVEGGSTNAPPNTSPVSGNAFTRCAAIACEAGVKAEQNWQGFAHQNLRLALEQVVLNRNAATAPNQEFNYFDATNSFIMFGFRWINSANGIAAKVYTYDANGAVSGAPRDITQAKRDEDTSTHRDAQDYLRWLNDVSIDDLIETGNVMAHHVFANQTSHHSDGVMHKPSLFKNSPIHEMSFSTVNGTGFDDYDVEEEEQTLNLVPVHSSRVRAKLSERTVNAAARGPLIKRANSTALAKAQAIIDAAQKKSAQLNALRFAHPLRNKYTIKPGTVTGQPKSNLTTRAVNATVPVPQLMTITDEIAEAAALLAEAQAANSNKNVTKSPLKKRAGSYWMESIARKGTVPWGPDPNYVIFRNVKSYGAKGDGVTDDTAAIKKAMIDGSRCGEKCNGSTLKNAIVYFPPGNYLVSTTIPMPFGTQVIGDANNWPTIVASASFVGLGVLSADEYTGGGTGPDGGDEEYYINTANFYRQVRNIRIDVTATTNNDQGIAGIHWQVGQATSLQNIEFIAKTGTKQKGIFAENGSGGVMSDLTFRGGAFGIYGGQQQFTTQRMTFDGCATGVQLIWDWSWTWKSITMKNVGVGFRLVPESAGSGNIGSAAFMDSTFSNTDTAVLIQPLNSATASGSTGVYFENVNFSGVNKAVADTSGKTLLSSSGKVDFWGAGPVAGPLGRRFSSGGRIGAYTKQQGLLDSAGNYFERAKPQYQNRGVGDFVHVKDFGAKGDGVTDDTAAFQNALYGSQGKILFVDAGSYILTSTVTIPSGSKLVGETWSQLVASGSYFSDASNPKVMLKVGNVGNVGEIEMQDLLFTSVGQNPGLIMVEWNIKASSQGSAALWDCHARVGGATGTKLTPTECPPSTTAINARCRAASLMMRITSQASGYFENMWLWVADHMIDDPDLNDPKNNMVQVSVYVARGLLVESVNPTWMYGTASEHSVMYQYNFNGAKNIFAGLIQTESAYYQPNPPPPSPFGSYVGVLPGDPEYNCTNAGDFSGCDESWAVVIRKSANIVIGGAGLYSWFSNYAQTCIDSQACQKTLMLLANNYAGIRFRNLVTIGSKYMSVEDGKGIAAADYLNVNGHPRWSQITVVDYNGNGQLLDNATWIDAKIWDMDQPSFSCAAPCTVVIPPWTKATSVVNYPLLTVSQGTWTSTITRPPLTMGVVIFDPVTITSNAGAKHKRAAFADFYPKPASVPYYSPATYMGPNGQQSTITPTQKFPDQAASIGPGAAPPPTGVWPSKAIRPVAAAYYDPVVTQCQYNGWGCQPDPWHFGGMGAPPGTPSDPGDGSGGGPEDKVICPRVPKNTTTTTTRASTTTPSLAGPSPNLNVVSCFNKGESLDHLRIDNAINSFCSQFAKDGQILKRLYKSFPFAFPQKSFEVPRKVDISMEIFSDCEFKYSVSECKRYMEVPVDSCNCNGVNGKQGGVVSNNCMRFMVDPGNA